MLDIPTLETARLRLRPYRLGDFEAYAAMWADPAVFRYVGGMPFSREQAWTRFLRQIGGWYHLGFGFFALEDKQTGAFAGEAGFQEMRRELDPSIEGSMEAGWGLVSALQGKGLAEEAMRAAFEWASNNAPASRFTCIIDPGNAASLRVAEKLGFRRLAEVSYHGSEVVLHERASHGVLR